AAAGAVAAAGPSAPLPATLLGGLTVVLVFAGLGTVLGAPEVRDPVRALLRAAGPVTQAAERKPHGR
ncbi:hypothetical protein, partial [Kitasatospora sp. NPDC007106]